RLRRSWTRSGRGRTSALGTASGSGRCVRFVPGTRAVRPFPLLPECAPLPFAPTCVARRGNASALAPSSAGSGSGCRTGSGSGSVRGSTAIASTGAVSAGAGGTISARTGPELGSVGADHGSAAYDDGDGTSNADG